MQLPGQGPGGAAFRVARVVEEDPLVPLGSGQGDVPAVDDHHVIPAVTCSRHDGRPLSDTRSQLDSAGRLGKQISY